MLLTPFVFGVLFFFYSHICRFNFIFHFTRQEGIQKTCNNAYKKYIKSRPGASVESVKKIKELELATMQLHPLFRNIGSAEQEKFGLLSRMSEYRPVTTVLEFGKDPVSKTAALMRHKRKLHEPIITGFKRKREEVVLAKRAGKKSTKII